MKQNVNNIFSKENQNNLKARYCEGLKEVWKNDQKMIDWCMKQITFLVPICDGKYIVELTKPTIKTDFWFGESDCGQGPSHDENIKNMNSARFIIKDYFINENIKGIDDTINNLKDIINGNSILTAKHFIHYYNSSEDSPIHGFCFHHPWHGNSVSGQTWDLNIEDVKNILEAYKLQRERMITRLESYIKRFSTKKIGVHSYWIDR